MRRFAIYAFALSLAPLARAQEEPQAPPGGGNGRAALDDLEHLSGVPLPGEGRRPQQPASEAERAALSGLPVVRVTAFDPPAGFDPVGDADVPLGLPFDARVARQAVLRLWETGRYRDVRLWGREVQNGVELLIEVQPMLRIHVLTIEGNKALKDSDIERAIGYTADRTIVPDQASLIALKNKLLDAYVQHGYREAGATLRLETTEEPGQVELVVDIDEGRPERYTLVKLAGRPVELVGEPLAEQVGLEAGVVRNRARVEQALEELDRILARYGYWDAEVGQYVERRLGKYSLELSIPIQFGVRTQIRFTGNHVLRSSDLLEQLAPDGAFSTRPDSVAAGVSRLRQHYRRHGLFHARITVGRLCSPPDTRPSIATLGRPCPQPTTKQELVFRITEGLPVEVAGVLFKGNAHFSNEELQDELFAFMSENNPHPETFQQIDTETVDAIGLSDHRPAGAGKPRGVGAPPHESQRVYVPDLYLAAMDHLTGLYQEQGYLGVEVTDTCELESRREVRVADTKFEPLSVEREDVALEGDQPDRPPCLLINDDLNAMVVVISVTEGPQTKIHELLFKNNAVVLDAELRAHTQLAEGQPYNEFRLREAQRDIGELYGSKGYMFGSATFKMTPSPDMTRARVVFELNEGPRVRVGKIEVRGNSATSRRLILERLTLEPGDRVTPEDLSRSEQRLMELGIFEGATVSLMAPDVPAKTKNLLVQVTEAKPQYMELRGGVATVEGLRAGFEYGFRNLGGWAIGARFRARANYRVLFVGNEPFQRRFDGLKLADQLERHLLLGVSTDHFPGTHGVLGVGIDGINERLNEPAFSANRTSGYFRIKSSYLRVLPIVLRIGLERGELDLPQNVESLQAQPQFQKWARMPQGLSTFWVTGGSIALEMRDDVFNPSRGFFASVGADLVRSLANFAPQEKRTETGEVVIVDKVSNYVRAELTVSGYIPIYSTKVVLALSASSGYIFHLQADSTTWADRYFYLGGVGTLRGFFEESLIPEDVYQDWKSRLRNYGPDAEALLEQAGGEAMFLLRSELRYPLTRSFFGAVFFEAGNVWRDQGAFEPLSIGPEFRLNLRPVAGGGLRYMTPLGPISVDVGVNLNRRPHEEWFAWSFSIGSAF